jgi:site-specific DNA recombinase
MCGKSAVKLRIAIYLRISRDPDGTSTATQRQLRDCKNLAKMKSWNVAEVFEDVDVSAYREGVQRPAYEKMLDQLQRGEFDGVLVWKLDRLVRRVAEFERFWAVCERSGAMLASFNESLDTTSEIGMLIVRILVAFAQMESANTSVRMKARQRELAEAGRPKLNGRRPFGMSADWKELVEEEAELIREAADRLLAGDSMRSICIDWKNRGVTTTYGNPWQTTAFRRMMLQPRLWGERTHKGTVAGPGNFPAIIDKATGERVARALARPPSDLRRRRNLLSGILRCGRCGAAMRVGTSAGVHKYRCSPPPDGCGRVVVSKVPADEAVSEMVLYRLSSKEMVRALRSRRGGSATRDAQVITKLAAAENRQRELDSEWALGQLPAARLKSMQAELEKVTEGLRTELALARRADPLVQLGTKSSDIRRVWGELGWERQRSIISTVVERVTVMPTTNPGSTKFDLERLQPVWRV